MLKQQEKRNVYYLRDRTWRRICCASLLRLCQLCAAVTRVSLTKLVAAVLFKVG
jgi:hypothetical protein